jgi:protocatechuate 3,4-dioxygenase beta subunit
MKNRNLFLTMLLVVGLVLILWFLRSTTKRSTPESLPVAGSQLSESNMIASGTTAEKNKPAATNAGSEIRAEGISSDRAVSYPDRAFDDWRTPISFYGRVVDESNRPVDVVSQK